ncbi:2-polyprenyl-6-methoxyphenol hydroxylase-like FAD-dependent oxidoreductase [Herbihabitans rhizosphaerae]|uniref:2-polyprenyl-6-methoxyphenol hydroxylase-like FAD-dependent oxidoreductase n=1 Tax=Herbihabitans rhizosphaerae TaxID=1872711 RepID=A0A4Q7L5X4_9PSEU|nr:NAD(P)/FAD-dependent oxidoreductase [Herbihabitans rhizosphaerae]RZS45059.1 2-polyprenyl-6-methoxyphenol hydroxylase-like FAD-dependent oxidoreductase [Herbihabitans rhizosphaerae]
MRIIISGAGVGGLATAQGLLAAGHEVVVLERGELQQAGPSGYRLRLDSRAMTVLARLLPASLFTALLASGSGRAVNQRLTYLDQRLRPLGSTREGDRDVLTIGRGPLLRLLAHGIADHVREHRETRSFQITPDHVSITTTDGQTETGDVVIVAEGAHSPLRRQLLGDTGGRVLDAGMVSGRVPGRAADLGLTGIADALRHGYALATGRGGFGMFLSAHDPVTGPAVDPTVAGPIQPDLEDPYLIWALLGPTGRLPGTDAGQSVLRAAVEDLTRAWHPDIAHLPRLTDPVSLRRVALYAAPPVPAWPTTAVTLLGDAVHVVPPTGGIGASTAIRDAGHLVDALTGIGDRPALLNALHQYEQTMRDYADDIVTGSIAPLRWQHRLRHPLVYTAVTATRATTFALTGRSLPLPSRN